MKNLYNIRTIVTTDGEVDDMNSLTRLLLYANDMELCGLIVTSSIFHYSGTANKPALRWAGSSWVHEAIDAYALVYDNLKVHDERYPSPETLRSLYREGNISDVGEMDQDTPGSDLIKDVLLDDDERPVLIQMWGGTNTVARALKSIEETYRTSPDWEEIKAKVEKKCQLYIIMDQDETFKGYIEKHWHIYTILDDMNFSYFAYMWKDLPEDIKATLDANFFQTYILHKSPLLELYHTIADGYDIPGEIPEAQFCSPEILERPGMTQYEFISEGDSPAYFYLLASGLRQVENPAFGGWGGRFVKENDHLYLNRALDYNPYHHRFESEYSLIRWIKDIQWDFAVRSAWSTTNDYNKVAHYPIIEGIPENLKVRPGQTLKINVNAKDPNGLPLTYRWWHYFEASTYNDFSTLNWEREIKQIEQWRLPYSIHSKTMDFDDALKLKDESTLQVTITIPEDAQTGQNFSIILEVSQDTDLPLKSYQRIQLIVA